MAIAMFVIAIIFLVALFSAFVCALIEGYEGTDMYVPGMTLLALSGLSGAALAVLAIINFSLV